LLASQRESVEVRRQSGPGKPGPALERGWGGLRPLASQLQSSAPSAAHRPPKRSAHRGGCCVAVAGKPTAISAAGAASAQPASRKHICSASRMKHRHADIEFATGAPRHRALGLSAAAGCFASTPPASRRCFNSAGASRPLLRQAGGASTQRVPRVHSSGKPAVLQLSGWSVPAALASQHFRTETWVSTVPAASRWTSSIPCFATQPGPAS